MMQAVGLVEITKCKNKEEDVRGTIPVADMVSVLIHGVLKSTEIGGNPCEGGKKASILADAILIK